MRMKEVAKMTENLGAEEASIAFIDIEGGKDCLGRCEINTAAWGIPWLNGWLEVKNEKEACRSCSSNVYSGEDLSNYVRLLDGDGTPSTKQADTGKAQNHADQIENTGKAAKILDRFGQREMRVLLPEADPLPWRQDLNM